MSFKVRDLMIDVAPDVSSNVMCRPCTRLGSACLCTNQVTVDACRCTNLAVSLRCDGCSLISPYVEITPWTRLTPTCGGTVIRTPEIIRETIQELTPRVVEGGLGQVSTPQNLATLKAELRQALAQVEAQEQVMAENMKPQTLEEVEMLEQKFTEALNELRQQREDLRRNASR